MQVKLNNVRLAFPALFEAKAIADGPMTHGAAFLFSENSQAYKELVAAEAAVAKEKWAGKAEATLKSIKAAAKQLVKDGDTKSDYDGYEGMFFINANNKQRPTVIDRDRSPLTQADGKPYAGCYVNAIVDVWAQDNQYGKRVNASLKGVQFLKDGDSFTGGGVASENDFDSVEDGAESGDMV